jgi:hypothetical protein
MSSDAWPILQMADALLSQRSRLGCQAHGDSEEYLPTDEALEVHAKLCEWIREHDTRAPMSRSRYLRCHPQGHGTDPRHRNADERGVGT